MEGYMTVIEGDGFTIYEEIDGDKIILEMDPNNFVKHTKKMTARVVANWQKFLSHGRDFALQFGLYEKGHLD